MDLGRASLAGTRLRSTIACGFFAACVLLWMAALSSAMRAVQPTPQSTPPEPTSLKGGNPVAAELGGGKSHSYSVEASQGQYFVVSVAQLGVKVAVVLSRPTGEKLVETDHPGTPAGPASVAWIAEVGGTYRIEVRSLVASSRPGRYTIALQELRPASPDDPGRLAAWRAFAEAEHLADNGTAESLGQALTKYQEALSLWKRLGDRREEAACLLGIGQAHHLSGDLRQALSYSEQSLSLTLAEDDRRGEAEALTDIAMARDSLGESRRAIEQYKRALLLWRETGYEGGEEMTLLDLAAVYASTHEPETLECYLRALPIAERMGDEEGQSAIFMGMGLAHDWLGELQRALDDFDHSIALSRKRGDRRGIAAGLSNLSMTYNRIGEYQRALDVLVESLRLRRETGDRRGEAYTLTSLGRTYDLMGKKGEALAFYNQALRLRQVVGDRRGEAYTLGLLGMACSALGENEAALQYLEKSLELRRSLGGVTDVGALLKTVGVVRAALGEKQRALDTLAAALVSNRAMADPLQEAQTLYETARVEAGLGSLPEARERLAEALTLVESVRARLASSAQRAAFLATTADTFGLALDVWMTSYAQSRDPAFEVEALALAERARARSMLELLVESHVDIREGVAPVLLERETTSKRRLAAAVEKRMRLLSASHTEEQADAADREIGGLESELEKIESEVRADSPRYAALTQPQPATAADIQRSLDPETLLLEFGLGKERVFLWAITPAPIESYEIGKRSEIESAAHRLFDLLTESTRHRRLEEVEQKPGKSAPANAEYAKAASELSRRLLFPVRDRLSGKRLLIVADGALQYVPFGVLPDPARVGDQAVPLVAHHEVVSLPSASVLGAMRRDLAGRAPAPKALAVLADPDFERDDARVSRATRTRGDERTSRRPEEAINRAAYRSAPEVGLTRGETARIPRLLYSRREADSILRLVPRAASLRALDFEASREKAMSAELGHYRFVHFATHGFLNSARPELSGIVFSLVDSRGREVPGYLSTADAFNMNLPVDLVVLSGCQTALGRDVRGEGLVGLARGLMYAGARAVVASLWKVDDAATAEFMRRFYSSMIRDGLAPASALRQAQLGMSRSKLWSHPVHWAAFVFQGDWKPAGNARPIVP